MSRIYAGNLPYTMDEDQLREMFKEFGTVEDVAVIRDSGSGRSRGFGFVKMPDESAREAIDGLNGLALDGRALRILAARERQQRTPGQGDDG